MPKLTLASALVIAAVTGAPSPAHANSIPFPTDGSWLILSNTMVPGDFFTAQTISDGITFGVGAGSIDGADTWTWTSDTATRFDITDWSVATDRFNVFDNGQLVFAVSGGTEWQDIAGCSGGPGDPSCGMLVPFNVDAAFSSPFLAHGSILFAPGAHALAVQDVDIPVLADDQNAPTEVPFPNGTVAFRVENVTTPEPATLVLVGVPLAWGAVSQLVRRRRRRAGTRPPE